MIHSSIDGAFKSKQASQRNKVSIRFILRFLCRLLKRKWCPDAKFTCADLLYSWLGGSFTAKRWKMFRRWCCFMVQVLEHCQENDAYTQGYGVWICFIVQLVGHWLENDAKKWRWRCFDLLHGSTVRTYTGTINYDGQIMMFPFAW